MKKDVTELKKMFVEILQNPSLASVHHDSYVNNLKELKPQESYQPIGQQTFCTYRNRWCSITMIMMNIHQHEEVEESLNIMDKEKELIVKALKKHKGKTKRCRIRSWHQ